MILNSLGSMNEKDINKLNVNPFLGSLIFQAFYKGYGKDESPLVLQYLVLPFILYGLTRNPLLSINKNSTLFRFSTTNKINLIDLQDRIWALRQLTNQSLIVLHNSNDIKLSSSVYVKNVINYTDYNDDMKMYLRSSTYLGILLSKESTENVFRILKVIP